MKKIIDTIKIIDAIFLHFVSIAGLTLAACNLQYTLFNDVNDVKASILKFRMSGCYDKDNVHFSGDDYFNSQIAFTNSGNKSAVISHLSIGFRSSDKKDTSDQKWDDVEDMLYNETFSRANGLFEPIVLKPGEIVLKEIVFGKGNLEKHLYQMCFSEKNIPVDSPTNIIVDMRFVVIDTLGKKHVIYSDAINIYVRGRDNGGIIISYLDNYNTFSKPIILLSTKSKTFINTYLWFLIPKSEEFKKLDVTKNYPKA